MRFLLVVAATALAMVVALLVCGVIYAYGNALFLWEGWLIVGGALGVGVAYTLVQWIAGTSSG